MKRPARHSWLIDEVRRRSPAAPGVYLFRGERNEILYVGKAVNLQQRMLSHLRVDPLKDPSRHSRMVYEVRDFEFQTTTSELLALLREDELIKRHRPRFNVRQNEFLEYKYLELTTDAYPRLRLLDHEADFGSRQVFGPYRDRYFIDDVLGLIREHAGLRSCSPAEPVDRCLEFDLGHCMGPCRGAISRRQYDQIVARAVAFLDGDVSEVAARVRTEGGVRLAGVVAAPALVAPGDGPIAVQHQRCGIARIQPEDPSGYRRRVDRIGAAPAEAVGVP